MFHAAVQRHGKENATIPKPSLESNPPKQTSLSSTQARASTPNHRNPLKPATSSAWNGLRGSQEQQRVQSGIKRTASGLAKVLNGSFDDGPGTQHRPISVDGKPKNGIVQLGHNEFIDENEFDSDIDLDFDEPVATKQKKDVSYPDLPTQPTAASPSKPLVYPTLPRQQQLQASYSPDLDSANVNVNYATAENPPGSSAPIPWSSSPAEHFTPSIKPSSTFKAFTYKPNQTQHAQNGPPPPKREAEPTQPKPAKRSKLPWASEETPKDKPKYLWNTSASAIKEQQRAHRAENGIHKKNVIRNEGDEDTILAAKSNNKKVPKVFLSEEQQHVLKLVVEDKKSVFFTGSAGTGKSVLMREIISCMRKKFLKEPDRLAVTASTGLAACNVGGVTLHSFAGIGLGKEDVPELVKKIKRNQKAKQRWLRAKVLIIDEVSMVDGDLFDKLEAIGRQIRNNGRPFGGIQLVITGDFFQLPPVPDYGRTAKFAFDAATWKTTIEHTIGLHHVFRQKDPVFAGMLNEMREGRLTQSSIAAFRNLSRPLDPMYDLEATELFPTRMEVDNANNTRLNNLQGDAQVFEARDGGAITDKAMRDKLLANCMAPETIVLKKGSQVMLIKNIDESLVNGSIGRVLGFMDEKKFDSYTLSDDGVPLNDDGTLHSSTPDDPTAAVRKKLFDTTNPFAAPTRAWPVVRFVIADGTSRDMLCQPESYKIELPNGEVQASRVQIPLILAWALSIHKAQGQTLERVKVDLGKTFEKGQAYVALSRATNMAGLQVLRFDPKKVVAHERVRTFYSNLSRVELAEKNRERLEGGRRGSVNGAGEYERRFVEDGS